MAICPRCMQDKASAAPMARGYQILCPCGYADTVPSLVQPVVQQPLPQKDAPPLVVEEIVPDQEVTETEPADIENEE